MAILDRLEELCKTVLDPSYEPSEKEVKQTHKIALLVKEWRQTGRKPKGLLHELFILYDLSYEKVSQDLKWLQKWAGIQD